MLQQGEERRTQRRKRRHSQGDAEQSQESGRKQRQRCARQNGGQKYQEHNRTLLGTGTRQEHWGKQGPQLGVCVNYSGAGSDKGCLEYATQNTTEVFWMKTLLDADDALLGAEHALAAANRTLDDVTRLSENAHNKHAALVAALTRENGAQARDAAEAPQSAGASAETATKGDAQRDSRKAPRKDTPGEASTAETQSSTDSAHFGC
ncbi:hypothetical protein ERJ75_001721600 [Trypanosoma vivax]|nr:hypothetical protein ERJ75_001721600 [Trypanosoma vivax]